MPGGAEARSSKLPAYVSSRRVHPPWSLVGPAGYPDVGLHRKLVGLMVLCIDRPACRFSIDVIGPRATNTCSGA